jgi:heme-degrading monooxygenase HmoA
MIVRLWRGEATAENADAYVRHLTGTVFPSLRGLPGHRSAHLLRRKTAAGVEFLAVTEWDSVEAIEAFAGKDIETAIVELEARAILSSFDTFARHYERVD